MRRHGIVLSFVALNFSGCSTSGSSSSTRVATDNGNAPPLSCLSTAMPSAPLEDYEPDGDNLEGRLCSLVKAGRDEDPKAVASRLESRTEEPSWVRRSGWRADGKRFAVLYGVGTVSGLSLEMSRRASFLRGLGEIAKLLSVTQEQSHTDTEQTLTTHSIGTLNEVLPLDWWHAKDGTYYTLVGQSLFTQEYEELCRRGDSYACDRGAELLLAGAGVKPAPQRAFDLLGSCCDRDSGECCNALAWKKCHDLRECDDLSLTAAMRATRLVPQDPNILDTVAYVKCARGEDAEGDQYYQKSCAAGSKVSCAKTCAKQRESQAIQKRHQEEKVESRREPEGKPAGQQIGVLGVPWGASAAEVERVLGRGFPIDEGTVRPGRTLFMWGDAMDMPAELQGCFFQAAGLSKQELKWTTRDVAGSVGRKPRPRNMRVYRVDGALSYLLVDGVFGGARINADGRTIPEEPRSGERRSEILVPAVTTPLGPSMDEGLCRFLLSSSTTPGTTAVQMCTSGRGYPSIQQQNRNEANSKDSCSTIVFDQRILGQVKQWASSATSDKRGTPGQRKLNREGQ